MVEQALLVARVAFVVLLYLFVWRVVRLSARDIRAPQESMVISAEAARAAGLGPPPAAPARAPEPRFSVVAGPGYPPGTLVLLEDDVTFGRAPDNDVVLESDGTASAHHARAFRRGDAVYLDDLGSTNGTFVNGQRLVAERLLRGGDRVQLGALELRFDEGPR